MEPKRLYRSLTDRKIAGVCGGLAEYFDTDPMLMRLAFVVLVLAGGSGVLVYFIFWIVTPEKPINYESFSSANPGSSNGNAGNDPFRPQDPFKGSDPFRTDAPKPSSTDPFSKEEKQKGSLIGGLILITLGALFLIDQLVPGINFGDLWPVILVVIGAGLLFNAFSGKK